MFKRWNLKIHDPSKPILRSDRFNSFMEFLRFELELAEYASKEAPIKKNTHPQDSQRNRMEVTKKMMTNQAAKFVKPSTIHYLFALISRN